MVKVRSAFTFSVKNEMHAKQLMTVWCLSVISNRSLGSDGLRPFKFFNIFCFLYEQNVVQKTFYFIFWKIDFIVRLPDFRSS